MQRERGDRRARTRPRASGRSAARRPAASRRRMPRGRRGSRPAASRMRRPPNRARPPRAAARAVVRGGAAGSRARSAPAATVPRPAASSGTTRRPGPAQPDHLRRRCPRHAARSRAPRSRCASASGCDLDQVGRDHGGLSAVPRSARVARPPASTCAADVDRLAAAVEVHQLETGEVRAQHEVGRVDREPAACDPVLHDVDGAGHDFEQARARCAGCGTSRRGRRRGPTISAGSPCPRCSSLLLWSPRGSCPTARAHASRPASPSGSGPRRSRCRRRARGTARPAPDSRRRRRSASGLRARSARTGPASPLEARTAVM